MIQEFLTYQRDIKGLAAQTVEGYEKELRHFIRYAQKKGLRWSSITRQDIDAYTASEGARGMKPRTIRRRVEVLRLLFTWAIHKGILTENPAQYSQTPKIRESLPKAADGEAIRRYLGTPMLTAEDLQTHFMVALMLETGMRFGEVLKLEGRDIDREQRTIRVTGKGAKERLVFYGKETEALLQHYVNVEERLTYGTERECRYMIYRHAGRFCPRIHPHAIRHTFATEQLAKGMKLKTLSTLLGHTNIATTEIYAKATAEVLATEYKSLNN